MTAAIEGTKRLVAVHKDRRAVLATLQRHKRSVTAFLAPFVPDRLGVDYLDATFPFGNPMAFHLTLRNDDGSFLTANGRSISIGGGRMLGLRQRFEQAADHSAFLESFHSAADRALVPVNKDRVQLLEQRLIQIAPFERLRTTPVGALDNDVPVYLLGAVPDARLVMQIGPIPKDEPDEPSVAFALSSDPTIGPFEVRLTIHGL